MLELETFFAGRLAIYLYEYLLYVPLFYIRDIYIYVYLSTIITINCMVMLSLSLLFFPLDGNLLQAILLRINSLFLWL